MSKSIISALIGVAVFAGGYWLAGFDVPTERGKEAFEYAFYTVNAAILGVGFGNLWGAFHP